MYMKNDFHVISNDLSASKLKETENSRENHYDTQARVQNKEGIHSCV